MDDCASLEGCSLLNEQNLPYPLDSQLLTLQDTLISSMLGLAAECR
jgi:hypothetical protein